MLEVKEVLTRKQKKDFIELPLKFYKNVPFFVPAFYGDEKKALNRKSPYEDVTESVFFLAYKDGKPVGRIHGIIQKQYNQMRNQKRVRFDRFESTDDPEVSSMLFKSLEDWAKSKGMNQICGPLGYSDFEREGLLIEGFDQYSTYEEQYNFDYYQKLIEDHGFQKEADWVESKIYPSKPGDDFPDRIKRLAKVTLRMQHLHLADNHMSIGRYLKKRSKGFFDCIDETYKEIYGAVPFVEKTRKMVMDEFKLILRPEELMIILDENEKTVGVALCFPSIAECVRRSNGKITMPFLFSLLKSIRHPKVMDLGLIGILPQYRNTGLVSVFLAGMVECMEKYHLDHLETNLNLENNIQILDMWKRFNSVQNKRRRSYIKDIK